MRFVGYCLVALLVGTSAWADLVAAAGFQVAPPAGTSPVRWPDVAFDPVDDVFLAVSGAGKTQGQYFTGAGAASGASFVVNSGAIYGQAPRVTFASDVGGFLVTWHETIGNDTRIRARILRYGKTALTDDFDLSPFGTNWEMGASAAYASTSKEFLVGWQDRATTQIHVQRVSSAGALLGPVITVEATGYARDPSIGYDPDTNRFLVAYGGCVGNNDCFIHAQRIQAGTGARVGAPIALDAPIKAGYVPEVAYNTTTHEFLVVWYRITAGVSGLHSKTINASAATGPLQPVGANGSYDANSVAYNPASNTFVVVSHSSGNQDIACELSASGQALSATGTLFGSTTAMGNFNPRVAASTLTKSWLGVTSSAFTALTAQRLTIVAPPVDAGAADAGLPKVDSGSPVVDSGIRDSGVAAPDAGLMDAGIDRSPEIQTSAGTDAGAPSDGGMPDAFGSVGCSVQPGSSLPALVALTACASGLRRLRRPKERTPRRRT